MSVVSPQAIFSTLAGILLVGLAACSEPTTVSEPTGPDSGQGGGRPGGRAGGEIIPAVEAVRAERGRLPLEERLTGQVRARNQTEIYPEVSGRITEIYVDNGQFVAEGDPLLQIRNVEVSERYQQAQAGLSIAQAQTRQAQANLDLLTAQLRRTQELRDRNLEAAAELEIIQSQVAVAEADLDLRQAQQSQAESLVEERRLQLENTTVRAPVSGQIGQRNAERGMMATSSTPLFIIGDLSQISIEVLLTERMLSYIEEGTPVNLYSESWPGTVLQSEITRISPFLDSSTMRTVADIEIDNANGLLRSGMFLTVDVLYGETEEVVLVPNSAFYRHPRTGIEGIYVVKAPGQEIERLSGNEEAPVVTPPLPVSFVPVEIIDSGRMASGVRGINAGDWVVTIGQNLLMGNVAETRARLISWDRMLEMQQMHSRDLFKVIDQHRSASQAGDNS